MTKRKRTKTDRRTLYTKKVIQEAFMVLFEKKELKQITVTEICKLAEINRSTFYLHYEDIYDVFEDVTDEIMEELLTFDINEILSWELMQSIYQDTLHNRQKKILVEALMKQPEVSRKYAFAVAQSFAPKFSEESDLTVDELEVLIASLFYTYNSFNLFLSESMNVNELEKYNRMFNETIAEPFFRKIKRGLKDVEY